MYYIILAVSIALIGFLGLAYYLKSFSRALKKILLIDFLVGLGVTGKYFFKKKVTLRFPDEQLPISPRFRGVIALRKYPNGEERCIACKLCEAVCPALAIKIESEPRDDGSRRTTRFDLDVFKCINCGLCEEACPVDSIVSTPLLHTIVPQRGDNIMSNQELLAGGDMYESNIARNHQQDRVKRESQEDKG